MRRVITSVNNLYSFSTKPHCAGFMHSLYPPFHLILNAQPTVVKLTDCFNKLIQIWCSVIICSATLQANIDLKHCLWNVAPSVHLSASVRRDGWTEGSTAEPSAELTPPNQYRHWRYCVTLCSPWNPTSGCQYIGFIWFYVQKESIVFTDILQNLCVKVAVFRIYNTFLSDKSRLNVYWSSKHGCSPKFVDIVWTVDDYISYFGRTIPLIIILHDTTALPLKTWTAYVKRGHEIKKQTEMDNDPRAFSLDVKRMNDVNKSGYGMQ